MGAPPPQAPHTPPTTDTTTLVGPTKSPHPTGTPISSATCTTSAAAEICRITALKTTMASNAAELQVLIAQQQGDDLNDQVSKQARVLASLVADRTALLAAQNTLATAAVPARTARPTTTTPTAYVLDFVALPFIQVTLHQLASAFDMTKSHCDRISPAATAARQSFPDPTTTLADALRSPPLPTNMECVPTLLRLISTMPGFHLKVSHTLRSPDDHEDCRHNRYQRPEGCSDGRLRTNNRRPEDDDDRDNNSNNNNNNSNSNSNGNN